MFLRKKSNFVFSKMLTSFVFLGRGEEFPAGFDVHSGESIVASDDVPDLCHSYERKVRDIRRGVYRNEGDGVDLAVHLNCFLVDASQNFYGVILMSPLDLLRQDQNDQFVSPCDQPVDFEGHNKTRHIGARMMYECILDKLNLVVDKDGYVRSFGPVGEITLSLGLGNGKDLDRSGPPAQISHLCVLINGGHCVDTRGHGKLSDTILSVFCEKKGGFLSFPKKF